jgi:hypothetical protein
MYYANKGLAISNLYWSLIREQFMTIPVFVIVGLLSAGIAVWVGRVV